jgi:hypothetical protein
MIRQHEQENTLVKNPRGQLSVKRIQQPIDTTAVNRWKTELEEEEIKAFLKACGGKKWFAQLDYSLS